MAAYVIALREKMKNADEMATYSKKVMSTLAGVKPLAAYGKYEVVEGAPIDGAVILEFASYDEAKAWYGSAAYQEAKKHRLAGADYHFIIVDGL